jgi:hypothetical protein
VFGILSMYGTVLLYVFQQRGPSIVFEWMVPPVNNRASSHVEYCEAYSICCEHLPVSNAALEGSKQQR